MAGNKSYHIYIHNEGNGGGKKPTTPENGGGKEDGGKKPTKPGRPWRSTYVPSIVPGSRVINVALRAYRGSMTPYGVLAATITAVKTAEQVVTTMNNIVAPLTGDYVMQMAWSNAMQMQNNILNPISSSVRAMLQTEKWEVARAKQDENRTLLGDTALNTLTKEV